MEMPTPPSGRLWSVNLGRHEVTVELTDHFGYEVASQREVRGCGGIPDDALAVRAARAILKRIEDADRLSGALGVDVSFD